MASIEPRNGGFRVRYRVHGASRSKTFSTWKAAREFRTQVEADLASGAAIDPRDARITLSAWTRDWQATRLHLRASTNEKNRHLANRYLAEFGRLPLGDLTTADIQAWVARLDVKPSTAHELHSELKKCLHAAVQARRLRTNPCIGVNLPAKQREPMTFLSPTEVAKLAESIDPHFRSLVFFWRTRACASAKQPH
ncbi:hypothetical protein [Geodermatophilus sp. SYSU D00700]